MYENMFSGIIIACVLFAESIPIFAPLLSISMSFTFSLSLPFSFDSWIGILNPASFVHHFIFILEPDWVGFTSSIWMKYFTGHWFSFWL